MSDKIEPNRSPVSASASRQLPILHRVARLPRQLAHINPFQGTIRPTRVPLLTFRRGRPSLPFPHPWNYHEPLRILDSFFWRADNESGHGRHNRYLDVPGFAPVFVTRDPRVIRAISAETGDKPGQFDRDTLPSSGIARATGRDTLLYANGAKWKLQKKLSTPPFARTTLFQPEQFHEFERSFRQTAAERLELVRKTIDETGQPLRVALEPEIKAVMLEMLVNNFFGASVPYDEIRNRHVPALERVIDHIITDTVLNKIGLPLKWLPNMSRRIALAKESRSIFEELTDKVIATRKENKGLWKQFKSEAPDESLRSNIRVFLAGALEATTSYASWAISHLARNAAAQDKAHHEIKDITDYSPATLESATYLDHVLNETLRLTPSLYFHPRKATVDTWIETSTGDTLMVPAGTHVLLAVWHANRHEDFWGVEATGFPACEFVPERWETLAKRERGDLIHFGFGHGPRFCPGKSLGQLEVALVVGAFVKLFQFTSINQQNPARAGVSTKPLDGVLVELRPRQVDPAATESAAASALRS